jgi:hypothetical protein
LHGVKIQTCTLPNGLIADVFGPVSVRHNDLFTLGESRINPRMRDMQQGVFDILYALYGDSAYPIYDCILSRHLGDDLNEVLSLENECMSSVRESIEWVNADIKSKFAFISFHKGLKLRHSPNVIRLIVVACILTNCYKCLNGCQTSKYFDLKPPSLEEYLSM